MVAQACIDSAKRSFDIDVTKEIARIKKDMKIKKHGYPAFWLCIRKGFNQRNINFDLKCPMNCLYELRFQKFRANTSTLQMDYFFQKFPMDKPRKKCRKVEELINRYSFELYNYNSLEERDETYLLLQTNFDAMLRDIRQTYVSSSYVGLFSWLLDRAFMIKPHTRWHIGKIKSTINKNKSLLLKVLYEVNPDNLLKCFSKNLYF